MNEKPTCYHESFEATPEEETMLRQLRSNSLIAVQFQAIANKSELEIANGMDAHQAEEAMIEVLQELGKKLMPMSAKHPARLP